ncbi:MlaD family protein [Ideonella sp. A 288]|uniref:MlaD family protein n=1 Tax=Ideonella sp. A 288 TaxID=1962181 RepID=UPI0018FED9F9|nr:MlaD family protein [Ideonella sp. A 288]
MNLTLVGAFVLALGAVIIAVVLWLASGGAFAKSFDRYLAIEDESVAGLNVNAPVKLNGVDVGKVQSINLDPTNPERVQLVFAIERGTPIKADTVAVLKTQGLTGIAYVELGGGTRSAEFLVPSATPPYPVIRTNPSLSARLENVLTDVLAKLDRTSTTIDELLSVENRTAFKSALADIAAVSRTVAGRKEAIAAGIGSAARTFEHAERVSAQLGPVVERVGRSAAAVETLGEDAAAASRAAGRTVAEVGADVQRVSAETLPELQRLLGELSVLSASMRRLSEQTERQPSSLLFGRSPVPDGPGESSTGTPPR